MSINTYDHEDAFQSANRCAGRRTQIADALKLANNQDQARAIILDAQKKYEDIFESFIEGVAWAREEFKRNNK